MLSPDIKLFQGIKRGLELLSVSRFLHNFWAKTFLLLYYINWPSFIVWLPLPCEILGNMCIAIVCKPGCEVMNLKVNLIFLIKPFFLHDQKVVTKTKNILRTKRAFKIKQKAFFITFKGISIKQITQFFWKVRVRL